MTQAGTIVRPASRGWLLPAFLLIIGVFTFGNLAVFLSTKKMQATNHEKAQDAMVSIEEVNRIVHDIDQERLLVDAHIFESSPYEMQTIEQRLAAVQADMLTAANEDEHFATFPREHQIWAGLWQEVGEIRPSIEKILELSRRNQDPQAFAAMQGIERNFDSINHQAEKLIKLNRRAAADSVHEIDKLQRRSLILLAAITLSGVALALLLAWRVIQIVRRQDDQIARSTTRLEARNRELDAFAGRVAHDLNGPLNTINLSAVALSGQVRDQEKLGILHRSVRRMHELVQDLLALSRIDQAPSEAVAQTERIARMIEEELAAKVMSVDGNLRIDIEPAAVRSSEGLLRQALWNIAENSTKYRRPEVRLEIGIRGRVAKPFYEFRICDNGSGMAPDEQVHIFEPFFRSARVQSLPGTGLGLSIVKRIVEASEGTIAVKSKVGTGTTFRISLPLAGPAAGSQAPGGEKRVS